MYKVALIEPFMTGSHKLWAENMKRKLPYHTEIFSLPGFNWKWRMHGGAVKLAEMFMESSFSPDIIIVTDMLDLSLFLSLVRRKSAAPVMLYFHENQLSYPWSPKDREKKSGNDKSYGWLNISSFISADKVCFNSEYHMNSFISEAEKFLSDMPDCKITDIFKKACKKSEVLHLGLELENIVENNAVKDEKLILWNHRWEYDKNPEMFFSMLYKLSQKGCDFHLAVLGESYSSSPEIFEKAEKILEKHIVKFGYCNERGEYIKWLNRSSFLPVTSSQEFFGISVLEAAACGVIPFMPEKLTYPELFSQDEFKLLFYKNENILLKKIEYALSHDFPYNISDKLYNNVMKYDWKSISFRYIDVIDRLLCEIK